jgi:hypothetical protein
VNCALRRHIEQEIRAAIDDLLGNGEFQIAEYERPRIGLFQNAVDREGFLIQPFDTAGRRGSVLVDREADPVELELVTIDPAQRFRVVAVLQPLQFVFVVGAVIGAVENALNVTPLPQRIDELVGFAVGLARAFDDLPAAIEPIRTRLGGDRFGIAEPWRRKQEGSGARRPPRPERRSIASNPAIWVMHARHQGMVLPCPDAMAADNA